MSGDRFEPDAALVSLMDRDALNRVKGKPLLPATDDADHFLQCSHCRQYFDMRNLGDVMHHEQLEHEPIETAQ